MSWVQGHQWVQAARAERAQYESALLYQEQLMRQHEARRAEVAAQAGHALGELTATLLPRLDDASLARAAELTGYTPLVQGALVERMHAERTWLVARAAQIEADARFTHREHLRDPRGGKLVLEVAELGEAQRHMRGVLAQADHPRLAHLLDVGFGTPAYQVPFWRLSYYTDWEAGDQIHAQFPEKPTFAAVRDEILGAQQADASLEARLLQLRQQIAEGEALEREHGQSQQALATLEQRHLQLAWSHLGRHIVDSGGAAVGPRLAPQPDVDVLSKRLFGLQAKLTYLDRLAETELARMHRELCDAVARAERDILKFSRPKKAQMAIAQDAFEKRFRPRGDRYQKGWQRYQQASDTIYVFDRYDRGSWASDFLWWDAMSDGRIDGDFIPEVALHRHHHPDQHHDRDRWDREDEPAHAAIAPDAHDVGGAIGAFDPS